MFSRWCARPARARLFTGEDVPHAARRLLQQIRPTNTPTELPDLDLSGADESAPIERPSVSLNRVPCEQGSLRTGEGRPSLLSSGVAEYATPGGNDRSLRRIYPNLMDPGTSCR
jgi:hypothetical protein